MDKFYSVVNSNADEMQLRIIKKRSDGNFDIVILLKDGTSVEYVAYPLATCSHFSVGMKAVKIIGQTVNHEGEERHIVTFHVHNIQFNYTISMSDAEYRSWFN